MLTLVWLSCLQNTMGLYGDDLSLGYHWVFRFTTLRTSNEPQNPISKRYWFWYINKKSTGTGCESIYDMPVPLKNTNLTNHRSKRPRGIYLCQNIVGEIRAELWSFIHSNSPNWNLLILRLLPFIPICDDADQWDDYNFSRVVCVALCETRVL